VCLFFISETNMLVDFHGGEGGIRTLDTVARMPDFESGAFDHSATSPMSLISKGYIVFSRLQFEWLKSAQ
jgi:hypothetical protein